MARKPYLTFLKFLNYVMLSSKSSILIFHKSFAVLLLIRDHWKIIYYALFGPVMWFFLRRIELELLICHMDRPFSFGWATVNKTKSSSLGFTLSPSWSTALLQDCFIIIYQRIIVISLEFIIN